MVLVVKNPSADAGDVRGVGLIPRSGWSLGGGHGNPLQYSCLENPTVRGAWRAMVQRIAKSGTQLKRLWTHTLTVKEMLRLFNKRRFLCVECLGLVTTFNGYHSSYVYLRYKLSKTHLRNINVGWRRLAWKQKNTLRVDKYSRICISSSSNKQESDSTKR